MIRISDISFFRFCWKNEKLDWPKCARTVKGRPVIFDSLFFLFRTFRSHFQLPRQAVASNDFFSGTRTCDPKHTSDCCFSVSQCCRTKFKSRFCNKKVQRLRNLAMVRFGIASTDNELFNLEERNYEICQNSNGGNCASATKLSAT